ncbi:MAG: hypothetical protein WD022_06145, partial [Balneolaceae bacterium]
NPGMILPLKFHDFMENNTIANNQRNKNKNKPEKPFDISLGIPARNKIADLRGKKFHAGI